jgi:DNA mismatch repair protein MutL
VEKSIEKSGCPDGTTIIIRDLFFNVPARRKFLKKDVTESNAVSQILQKITMSHPEIAFRFIRDNRMEFSSAGDGELYSAVYAVYGRDFSRDLLPVDYEYEGVRVSGYSVRPLYSKTNRSFQNFFVNGRYVRSKICSSALENAYSNMVMTGKFPACVLMIELPPAEMDVNIHPAKAEVRFTKEKSVADAIYFAVRNAFVENGLLYEFELKKSVDWTKKPEEQPEMKQQEFIFTPVDKIEETEKKLAGDVKTVPEAVKPEPEPETAYIAPFTAYNRTEEKAPVQKTDTETATTPEKPYTAPPEPVKVPEKPEIQTEPESAPKPVEGFSYINSSSFRKAPEPEKKPEEQESVWTEKPKIKVIGEAFGVYIVAQIGEKQMVMIDKHAAHERMIFNDLMQRNCRQYSQMLMTGISILLTGDDFSALEANTELLADMGFSFDFSQRPCVVVTAVPTFIMELDVEEIVSEIAENLRMHRQNPQSRQLDDMMHTVACKAAIKGNDKTSLQELQALAERVYNDENIRHCPHGRPVMFTMNKSSIEHQFGRT